MMMITAHEAAHTEPAPARDGPLTVNILWASVLRALPVIPRSSGSDLEINSSPQKLIG